MTIQSECKKCKSAYNGICQYHIDHYFDGEVLGN